MKIKFILLIIALALSPLFLLAQPDEEYIIIEDYAPNTVEKTPESSTTINLKSFNAEFIETEGFVQLRWKLDNILGAFIIEHSTDGENYHQIGIVNSASGFESDYFVFEAREFDPKFNFYRLKQIINGEVIYSKALNFSVSPNDDEHTLMLEDLVDKRKLMLRVRDEQHVTIKLINSRGVVIKILLNQELGINEIIFRTIDKGSYVPGDYFLLIEGETFKQSKKIHLP